MDGQNGKRRIDDSLNRGLNGFMYICRVGAAHRHGDLAIL